MSSNFQRTVSPDSRDTRPKDFHFHPGYSVVLVRTELKDQLKQFRRERGFGHDTHIERCLLSAGLSLLLQDASLHGRWIQMLADATSQDVLLASQQQIRGA